VQCSRCSRIDPPTSASEQFFVFSFVMAHDLPTTANHDLIPDSLSVSSVSITPLAGQPIGLASELDARGIHAVGPVFFYDDSDAVGIILEKSYVIDTPISAADTAVIQYRVVENECGHKYLVNVKALVNGTLWLEESNGDVGSISSSGEQTTLTIVLD
jgi:hypothetical protein